MESVDVTAVMLVAVRHSPNLWTIKARIINVVEKVPAERALIGCLVDLTYRGTLLPHLALKVGLLIRVGIPLVDAERHLDLIAEGNDPFVAPPLVFEALVLRPMTEPCVRVPLSLLRELRSQEFRAESVRSALVHAWTEDRKPATDA